MKYHVYIILTFIFTATSLCNAQTLPVPSLQSPTYDYLLNLSESNVEKRPSISSTSRIVPIPSILPKRKENLLKVTTIAPTHYADTHNAFFCRMERKINKKFIMPVRIRLEGF